MEIIKKIETTMPVKANIDILANELTDGVASGFVNPLEFLVKIEFLTKVLEQAKKQVKDLAVQSLSSNESLFGAKIELAETGVKYDYSQSESWQSIKAQIEPLETELKAIEEQIKMATKIGKSFVDESTGELISPVQKTSTASIKITLGK
ncbi:MAG: hypothetical protein H6553_00195 [Chitinophagales bacterium]|nr:hypothetical protein [Chitinophagales bacterium]